MNGPTPLGATGQLDLLVLGSGVAGLTAAVQASEIHGLRVGVLTKGLLEEATTRWAQGGIAAVLNEDPDSADLHLADTLAAGAGLCDADAVRILVDEGPGRVNELIALGAAFDRDAEGRLALAREGGHSLPRIVHAGGAATGVEVERALTAAVRASAALVLENAFATDLLISAGECVGVSARDPDGSAIEVRARNVLLATGGAGQLYSVTTNPREATGDGMAMALRAGAACADLEFVQFHPTALAHPRMPRPLLSEALRGHGALIRDAEGQRFVDELAPRDQVSREMTRRMLSEGVEHLWLDATGLDRFAERFPTIASALRTAGLDPARDWLPIAPAAHYICGGVVTDLSGATTVPGLWAAGEVACSGVHGANRLASNSLLEGMVFAVRAVEAVSGGQRGHGASGALREDPGGDEPVLRWGPDVWRSPVSGRTAGSDVADLRRRLQWEMTSGAGLLRDRDSLETVSARLAEIGQALPVDGDPVASAELGNLLDVAAGLVAGACARAESRGAHVRSDHPDEDPSMRYRIAQRGVAR